MARRSLRLCAAAAAFLALMLMGADAADAASIVVTTLSDSTANDGACSLREAIGSANADAAVGGCPGGAGTDTIVVPAGTFTIAIPGIDNGNATGDLNVGSNVIIEGAGPTATVLDGNGIDRVITFGPGTQGTLQQLTVTRGQAPAGTAGASHTGASASADGTGDPGGPGENGGGILSFGSLSLNSAVVTANRAGNGGPAGSGTGADGARGTPFGGGTGGVGGAGSGGRGGAGGSGGGVWSSGQLSITATTISANHAGDGGSGGNGTGGLGGEGAIGGGAGGDGGGGFGNAGGAGGDGGGLVATGGAPSIARSTIDGNAAGDGGPSGAGTGGGGGLGGGGTNGGNGGGGQNGSSATGAPGGNAGGVLSTPAGGTFVANTTIFGNSTGNGASAGGSVGGHGGAGGPGGAGVGGNGGHGGGAIFGRGGDAGESAAFDGFATIDRSTIAGNTAGAVGLQGTGHGTAGGSPGTGGGGPGTQGPSGGANGGAGNGFAASDGAVDGPGVTILYSVLSANSPLNCDGSVSGGGAANVAHPTGVCGSLHADPLLGPLAANGGPTATQRPAAGSPARDVAQTLSGSCGGTDQRGIPRPQGPLCDLGAYEAATPSAVTDPATEVGPTSATLNATVQANQRAASVQFEIGTTTSYGATTVPADGGGQTSFAPVSQSLIGLAPQTTYHYRVVAATPDGTATGGDQSFTTPAAAADTPRGTPDLTAPDMRSLALGRRFRAAGRGPSLTPARRATIGTKVKYSLSEPSTVTFTVERAAAGRKVGRSCRKPTRANASRKRCVRYVALNRSFAHAGTTGANSFRFTGRLANRKLAPARYRLVAVAADAAGNRSTARRAAFKIVR